MIQAPEVYVEAILDLIRQDAALRDVNLTALQASLRKAIAPRFEVVFAGAFSAGKSMLINVPLAAGGTNDLSNLQTLCAQCNRSKGKAYDPRFRRRFSL